MDDASLLGAETIRLDELQSAAKASAEPEPPVDRTEILRRMQMFRGIDPDHLDDLVRRLGGFERSYREQNEKYTSLGILLQGSIQPMDISREEPQIIQRFEAGASFGEAIAFGAQQSWVEIRAITPARVLFLPAANILDHGGDPEIVRIMSNLLVELSAKFSLLNRKNHLLAEPRLRNRLLMYFGSLSLMPNGIRIMPFGQKELAQYLNVNRSALNRELSRMKEEGVIEMDGRSVRILKQMAEQ